MAHTDGCRFIAYGPAIDISACSGIAAAAKSFSFQFSGISVKAISSLFRFYAHKAVL